MSDALLGETPATALAIYAHPDDPVISCGGTVARWAAAGSTIEVVICTAGDKGATDPGVDPDTLAAARAGEARHSLAVLAATGLHLLGHPDGEIENDLALRGELVEIIRDLRPEAIIAPDPLAVFFGEHHYNHRDHRVVGWAALDAAAARGGVAPVLQGRGAGSPGHGCLSVRLLGAQRLGGRELDHRPEDRSRFLPRLAAHRRRRLARERTSRWRRGRRPGGRRRLRGAFSADLVGVVTTALDILHVDMDAFFAAVEVLDDPSLRGRPVIVGGTGSRGVVASCSYAARATGVRSAMSMVEARHRCPEAVVLPGRHGRYGEVSRQLHRVFEVFTPLIEPIALDEAFLDVSGGHRLFGSSIEIAEAIRARVTEELQLSCSVGIARNKLLAKLASRAAKPSVSLSGPVPGPGIVVVLPADELAFLHPRPVADLWGVGPRTAARLAGYGIATIGDLAKVDPRHLTRLVGRAAGSQLHELGVGPGRQAGRHGPAGEVSRSRGDLRRRPARSRAAPSRGRPHG